MIPHEAIVKGAIIMIQQNVARTIGEGAIGLEFKFGENSYIEKLSNNRLQVMNGEVLHAPNGWSSKKVHHIIHPDTDVLIYSPFMGVHASNSDLISVLRQEPI